MRNLVAALGVRRADRVSMAASTDAPCLATCRASIPSMQFSTNRASSGGFRQPAVQTRTLSTIRVAMALCRSGFRAEIATNSIQIRTVGGAWSSEQPGRQKKRPRIRGPLVFQTGSASARGPCPNRSAWGAFRTYARAAGRAGSIPACRHIRSRGCSRSPACRSAGCRTGSR